MLAQELTPTRPQYDAQRQGDDQHIVDVPSDGNEVRHEVDRKRDVSDERSQEQLVSPGNAGIADQTPHEHDAVGDEAGPIARVAPAAGDDERPDERGVYDNDAYRDDQ
jgi:hypothetical protein